MSPFFARGAHFGYNRVRFKERLLVSLNVWIGVMSSRLRILIEVLLLVVGLSSLAACSFEPGTRTQLAGQECFSDHECAMGLTCVQRRCQYKAFDHGDAGTTDATTDVRPPTDASDVPLPPPPDGGPRPDADTVCQPGARRCSASGAIEQCVDTGRRWVQVQACADGLVCVGGQCVSNNHCQDNDHDGYGPGCARGDDCNDANPAIHPGATEICNTPVDDNCNGQTNEQCSQCCAGGCGDGMFCSNCQCLPNDPNQCNYQDQPCSHEGMNNGFYCTALGNAGQMRCLGLCQSDADNANSTCPDPGSICMDTGNGNGQGFCLSGCTLSQGCGLDGFGCLPIDGQQREGACVPINPTHHIGDRCDPQKFIDCEAGAFCIDLQNTGAGRCVEACRAFAHARDIATDCSVGHCVALSDTFGMCRRDGANLQEGGQCSRQQTFSACGQDDVTCYPTGGMMGSQCVRTCRLAEGDNDCNPGQTCYQFDQNRQDLGVCVDAPTAGGGSGSGGGGIGG